MNSSQAVNQLAMIDLLRAGRDASGYETAVGLLWNKYFMRMLLLARKKLGDAHNCVRNEEDIAASAFKSFCIGMRNGKFKHSSDLWPLLVTITINKSIDHIRHENRLKRGGGLGQTYVAIDELLMGDDSPELQLVAAETLEHLFGALDNTGDPDLRVVATLRLEDAPHAAIAQQLNCTVRTVQRKLKTIEAIWHSLGTKIGDEP